MNKRNLFLFFKKTGFVVKTLCLFALSQTGLSCLNKSRILYHEYAIGIYKKNDNSSDEFAGYAPIE